LHPRHTKAIAISHLLIHAAQNHAFSTKKPKVRCAEFSEPIEIPVAKIVGRNLTLIHVGADSLTL
jgi:hypothetical protein